jgi:hypothetical protein
MRRKDFYTGSGLPEDNGPTSCGLVGLVLTSLLGVPLPILLYPMRRGYKECNRVGYNMISIRTLSLLDYFIYIFIDIIIYTLGSTTWSSGIFWMVGRVIVDSFLGLLSLCELVPRVPILISSPRVLGKWVDAGWSGSSLFVTKYFGMKLLSAFSLN